MSYINKTLLKNEQVVFLTKPHWIVFGPGVGILLVALFVYGYGPAMFSATLGFGSWTFSEIFAAIIALIGLYSLAKAYIFFKMSEYGITNKRVLMKMGWIERNSLELFLDKIEGVNVDQSMLGRALGYGTLVIVGTGGSQDTFTSVPQPLQFRRNLQQQIDNYTHAKSSD